MHNILILGSNSDVGQACAHKFSKEGFNILLASRNIDNNQKKMASDLSKKYGIKASNHYFDALKTNEHLDFYKSIKNKPIIVISVFGDLGHHKASTENFLEAKRVIAVNYIGNVSILGIIAKEMSTKKRGTIICLSSVAGERGRKSNYIYGSAKAGLTAFLSGLRAEMFPFNTHVITVIPGFIRTKMIQNLKTPKLITTSPEIVANQIWKAYKRKKNIIFVLPIWKFIMLIIKNIPETIFKKINI